MPILLLAAQVLDLPSFALMAEISEWILWNPFFYTVDFGQLGYDSDELIEYTLTIQYDYATYDVKNNLQVVVSSQFPRNNRNLFCPVFESISLRA